MLKINFQHLVQNNIPKNLKQPHRSQIYVGYKCHQHCGFCYYKQHCTEPMFSRDYVLQQIDLELTYGITDFEITGGEPAECDDLVFYCKYIKDKLPTAKIAIITNGSLFVVNNIWKYIDEVLVSYHISKNDKNIDRTIFPLGDTYSKVFKTIECAKKFNKIVRTNTIIGTFNIDSINYIIDDLIQFKPDIINFLPVNLFDNAVDMDQYIDYTKIRPILKKCIDKIKNELYNTLICVRYMPFCDMEGYEQYILGSLQHIYDQFDWNSELQPLLSYMNTLQTNKKILEYLNYYGYRSFEKVFDVINTQYEKNSKCLKCKYYLICDGVEKTKEHVLLKHIVPTNGQMIKNPMEFINDKIYKKYKELYDIDRSNI